MFVLLLGGGVVKVDWDEERKSEYSGTGRCPYLHQPGILLH